MVGRAARSVNPQLGWPAHALNAKESQAAAREQVDEHYSRWEELESLRASQL